MGDAAPGGSTVEEENRRLRKLLQQSENLRVLAEQQKLQAEQQQEMEKQLRVRAEAQKQQAEQKQQEAEQKQQEAEKQQQMEKQKREQAEDHLQFALAFISTTMPEKEKGRLIVHEQATATAASFDELFDGCGLQEKVVDIAKWPIKPDGSESTLQLAVVKLLRDIVKSESQTVLSFALKPILFSMDKPDIVFVSSKLMEASGLQGKCSWSMVSFVAELKPSLFSQQAADEDELKPGHHYVDAGLEAVGQLANRAQRFHNDETFYGLVMGWDRVQFWRCDAVTRNWTRWPENGIDVFHSKGGMRGIDYIAAVLRGDAARLRPQGRIDDLTVALSEIRQVRGNIGNMPLVPMCGLRDYHALLVKVGLKESTVLKLWKDGRETNQMGRELKAMSLLRPGHKLVDGGAWCGLEMEFLGPVTMHELAPYISGKINPRVNLWQHMLAAVRQIAIQLRHLHKLGYVHCDVKPRNVVIKMKSNGVVATLIDFEHTVPIDAVARGYTMRFCAKYVLNQRDSKFPARRWQDWAALFYSLQSLIVHEEGHERFDAMTDPDAYWMRVRAPVSDADANRGRRLLQGMKHLTETEQTEAVLFMTRFAKQFQRTTTNIDVVPTALEDQQLEARMRDFWQQGAQ